MSVRASRAPASTRAEVLAGVDVWATG
jgi:hypothetical protein